MKYKMNILNGIILVFLSLLLVGCNLKQEYQYEANSTGGITLVTYNGHASTLVIPSEYDGKEVKCVTDIIKNDKDKKLKKAVVSDGIEELCIFRKNRALAPHERSTVPLGTDHCPVG